jgi:cyclase
MESVNIPVIVCGGVHHSDHFKEALKLGVSAVAAANFFHYTEHSVITVKRHLKNDAADIRLDSYASYDGFGFDGDGRLKKQRDSTLEKLRFEYIPEEII